MDGAEVDNEVLNREAQLVGHLQLHPRPVEPAHKFHPLLVPIGESNKQVSVLPRLGLKRPLAEIIFIGRQLD